MSAAQKLQPFNFEGSGNLSTREGVALFTSILVHALLLSAIFPAVRTATQPAPIKVRLSAPADSEINQPEVVKPQKKEPEKAAPAPPPQQIVSPSELPEVEPKEPTRLRSDKSTSTPRETVKRGEGGSVPSPKESVQRQQKLRSARANKAQSDPDQQLAKAGPSRSVPSLRLSERGLAKALERGDQQDSGSDRARIEKFSRAAPFEKLNLGLPGVPDYLPGVADGEMTLLNAKADKFAVFVRRVALQVFGSLRRLNWQNMPHGEVGRIKEFAVIRAVMSPKGKLISVELENDSGSRSFNQVVIQAVNAGAQDQNPPPAAAAEDGNIHFIFQSRIWSRMGGRGLAEQRWLLLGTGLE